MDYVLYTEELKECYIWIDWLNSYLREREMIMFSKYEENKANVDIDWRDNSSIIEEAEISDLLKKFYSANENDNEDNIVQYEEIDIVEEINDEVWTEKIHDYESDCCILWTHWLSIWRTLIALFCCLTNVFTIKWQQRKLITFMKKIIKM